MGLVVLHLAVYYLTTILIFDESNGPFQSKNLMVRTAEWARPVHLFDRLRWLFGAYAVKEDVNWGTVWVPTRISVWECSYCLGFWIAIPLVALYVYGFGNWQLAPFLVLSCAGFTGFLNRVQS